MSNLEGYKFKKTLKMDITKENIDSFNFPIELKKAILLTLDSLETEIKPFEIRKIQNIGVRTGFDGYLPYARFLSREKFLIFEGRKFRSEQEIITFLDTIYLIG